MAALPELSGCKVVCHCRPSEACHSDVLCRVFDEQCRSPVEAHMVYAGQSHFRVRWRRTMWAIDQEATTQGAMCRRW